MRDTEIGEHDLLHVSSHRTLGWWAECECGWISHSTTTEAFARRAHEHHALAHTPCTGDPK